MTDTDKTAHKTDGTTAVAPDDPPSDGPAADVAPASDNTPSSDAPTSSPTREAPPSDTAPNETSGGDTAPSDTDSPPSGPTPRETSSSETSSSDGSTSGESPEDCIDAVEAAHTKAGEVPKREEGGIRLPLEDEVGSRPSTAPFGDGRDGSPPYRAFMWLFGAGGAMLLLPRQYWAAGLCAAIALVFAALSKRLETKESD